MLDWRVTLPIKAAVHSLGGYSAHAGSERVSRRSSLACVQVEEVRLVHGDDVGAKLAAVLQQAKVKIRAEQLL